LQGIPADELFTAEESSRRPLGWGPYAIQEWAPGESIRLSWNPEYFRAGEGLPAFDTLIFRFVGQDSQANLEAIQAGECDLLDQGASLAFQGDGFQSLLAAQENGQLAADIQASTVWEQADFGIRPVTYDDGNQLGIDRPDFFGDVRTRQALAQCMDRQRIVDEVLFGLSAVPDSYLPPNHPLFNPDVARYPFDPAAGAALLSEAGWLDGDPATPRVALGVANVVDGTLLQFTYRTTPASQRQRAAEMLKDSLAQCGVGLEVVTSPAEELYAAGPQGPVFGRQFDLAQLAWSTGVHPLCNLWLTSQIPGDPNSLDENGTTRFPLGWGGQNASGYSSPAFDQACLAAINSLPGQPGYEESHREAQAIFAQDLPVVPLYLRLTSAVTRPDFCGFEMDASAHSELWNLEAFDYGEGCSGVGE
jgi:peptide/nickel transport system substrate-binding protein